ncbi:MAG TPA: hypothetical protein PKJ41_18125 [Bryobacteraceae bacterium]|nr:hypothetical protein [Bryobacteraceae bacterium]HPT25617.1 hypothetical protein [Bryobacteraceae bacterium]
MRKTIFAILILAGLAPGQTVINGNRAITGSWDASGAATTKPVSAGTVLPATCTTGAMYFKTDAAAGRNLYVCTAENTWKQASGADTKSITLMDPVAGDSGRVQIMFPAAVTLTRIGCSVRGATSVSINLDERSAATPDTAGTPVMSSALVCDENEASAMTFSNASIAARSPLALTLSVISGTPDTLRVFIEYTVD